MQTRLKITLFVTSVLLMPLFVFVASPQAAFAQTCKSGEQFVSLPVDQGGSHCIPINNGSKNIQDNPIFFYLRNILIFVGGGVGLAVVGGIITGSYMYITARANAGQTQKGQETIINSVIGLLLFIFMFAILQFLIPGGIFQ